MALHISDTGRGTPLVLVHGFPMDHRLWSGQAGLAGRARVLCPDLPGFGRSPLPEGERTPGLGPYAEAIRRVLDQAEVERAVLCGLSMGGYILFEAWRRFPERIAGLLFCDTRAEADPPEGKRARVVNAERARRGEKAALIEEMIPLLLGPDARKRRGPADALRLMARDASDEGIARALLAMGERPDSTSLLPSISVPTLAVVGRDDALTPPEAAEVIRRGIAGAELEVIDGAGHLSPMERPRAFCRAARHLLDRC